MAYSKELEALKFNSSYGHYVVDIGMHCTEKSVKDKDSFWNNAGL